MEFMLLRPVQLRINAFHRALLRAVDVKRRKYSIIKGYLRISHVAYIWERNLPRDDLFTMILRGVEDQAPTYSPAGIT